MKKTLLLFLFFNCQLSTVNWINAQRVITTERLEVTNVLDRNPDSEALRIVSKYKASVDSVMAPVLGESLVGMSSARPESLLSNWAADVLMEYSDFKDGKKADLAIVNVGGLRNNMPKGVVRRGDIILISPFDNRLAVVYIKGSDLLSLFQDVAAVHGDGVSREVRLVITQDGKLVDAKVSGQPIDPNRTYRIATLDYLAEGNDRLYSFKKAQKVDVSDLFSRDCMMQYVKQKSPISSKIEGRIIVK